MAVILRKDIQTFHSRGFEDLANRYDTGQRANGNLYSNTLLSENESRLYNHLVETVVADIKANPALASSLLHWLFERYLGEVPLTEIATLIPYKQNKLEKALKKTSADNDQRIKFSSLEKRSQPIDENVEWYLSLISILGIEKTFPLAFMREIILYSPVKPSLNQIVGYHTNARRTVLFDHFLQQERATTAFSLTNWEKMKTKALDATEAEMKADHQTLIEVKKVKVKEEQLPKPKTEKRVMPVFPQLTAAAAD